MTMTAPSPSLEEILSEPAEDEEPLWRLTVAGAELLGYEIDPSRRGQITAYSSALNLWVRMRR